MAEPVVVTAGGVRWRADPEVWARLIGPGGLRLREWLGAGAARVVKDGPHRTVYRVTLPGLDFHVKHYRLHGPRAWLRELVRPPKACVEYDRALCVAACDVPTAAPLAVGETWPRAGPDDSFLVTRTLEGAEPLNAFVERALPGFDAARRARVRQRLAVALGELLARMHDAGILHQDLHAGNLLVRLDKTDRPGLYLIDLHAVRRTRPLEWPVSRDNLVMLNRWFVLCAGRADRLRFWRTYFRSRVSLLGASAEARATGLVSGAGQARVLERATWESNLRFWRGRDRRYLGGSRHFAPVRAEGASGYAVDDLDRDALADLMADPDAPFVRPGARLLKDGPSSTVAEIDLRVGGATRRVVYKRFRVTNWGEPFLALLRRSPALRCWANGHAVRDRLLPTPRPLAVWHRRRLGLAHEGYVVTELVPGAADLHRFVAGLERLPAAERRGLLRGVLERTAVLVRELHRRRLSHRDLKASNVLVADDQVWLIDLVGLAPRKRLSRARRVQNLARLHASFFRSPALTRADKLRFLRTYLQWGLFGRLGWKRWWREVERATLAKAARNARRGRPLG